MDKEALRIMLALSTLVPPALNRIEDVRTKHVAQLKWGMEQGIVEVHEANHVEICLNAYLNSPKM